MASRAGRMFPSRACSPATCSCGARGGLRMARLIITHRMEAASTIRRTICGRCGRWSGKIFSTAISACLPIPVSARAYCTTTSEPPADICGKAGTSIFPSESRTAPICSRKNRASPPRLNTTISSPEPSARTWPTLAGLMRTSRMCRT